MSKEIEEAIKNCNLLLAGDIMLHILDDDGGTAYSGEVNKLYNKDLETVLNYIKELEEETNGYKNYIKRLDKLDTRDFMFKQVIRDKIDYLDNQQRQWKDERELSNISDSEIIYARDTLKELLEEE